jgi:putative membrane protein insertion efficiency factor
VRTREALWAVGALPRAALVGLIKLYRVTLGGILGGQCRFYPSCSVYAEQAIRTHGALRGSLMASWRVLRCHPFSSGGVDRVPAGRRHGGYDTVIPREKETP